MCLTVRKIRHLNKKPRIAKYDIKCYKWLIDRGYQWKTPFQEKRVHPFKNPTFCANQFQIHPTKNTTNWFITFAIHTFKSINIAKLRQCGTDLFECIIPKGTQYWIGKDGDYASRKIKFIKKID